MIESTAAADRAVVPADFRLARPPALSRSTVDRREQLRDDVDRQAEHWAAAKVLLVDDRGRAPVRAGGSRLLLRPALEFGKAPPEGAVLLGERDDTSYWAIPAGAVMPTVSAGLPAGAGSWQDLRAGGALLDDTGAGLLTTAVALLGWHAAGAFCAACGTRTNVVRAGWARHCPGCDREEYPRTDAAVICLVHDDADHVLLARQPLWPPHRYSVLAGFVEAGESMEACVEREIAEEVGIEVRSIRYLGSQPWPFPRSLMVGFAAIADRNATLTPAPGEIEDPRWVHRDVVRSAMLDDGSVSWLRLPGSASIASRMLEAWAGLA